MYCLFLDGRKKSWEPDVLYGLNLHPVNALCRESPVGAAFCAKIFILINGSNGYSHRISRGYV